MHIGCAQVSAAGISYAQAYNITNESDKNTFIYLADTFGKQQNNCSEPMQIWKKRMTLI